MFLGNKRKSGDDIMNATTGNRQRQALVDAPLCPRLFKAPAEALSGRFAAKAAKIRPVTPSDLKQSNLRAVLLQESEQVPGPEPHSSGVVIGMDPDQSGALQKGPVQPEGHLMLPVVEQTQRGHRAGDQAKDVHQILL